MAGWCVGQYGCLGVLTIDGIALNGPAWDIPNLSSLWFAATVRGESVVMPTAAGQRSNPVRLDEHTQDLLLIVNGLADRTGVAEPSGDPWQGLASNLEDLWSLVLQPIDSGRGTRAATLLMPDGSTVKTATVRTNPLQPVGDEILDPNFAQFTLPLTITSGMFV